MSKLLKNLLMVDVVGNYIRAGEMTHPVHTLNPHSVKFPVYQSEENSQVGTISRFRYKRSIGSIYALRISGTEKNMAISEEAKNKLEKKLSSLDHAGIKIEIIKGSNLLLIGDYDGSSEQESDYLEARTTINMMIMAERQEAYLRALKEAALLTKEYALNQKAAKP
ncbi:MAG: hypothetical protein IBX55_01100 [Methyloprofundus sp.]|nr:hypothetical protein [Methyloprofundus sp.]